MTTNLNAIAGPSRIYRGDDHVVELSDQNEVKPVIDSTPSNSASVSDGNNAQSQAASGEGVGVSMGGLKVDENGDVVKVPAFLNKLYSMVCDPESDELIYWSESGDSFFVPDHERFGKELLPRYFKHSNFSSFVRQLNMYGFHKVPHLQSGVLKNDAPSELWEFVNPLFKKGQPELLARVTRKNNRPTGETHTTQPTSGTRPSNLPHTVGLLTDGTIEGEVQSSLVGPQGHLVDLIAIQSGINAIRQTQASLGADLKALQTSNEHLWREALESRERQQKHEETIDLIVSFLERLFGTEGEGLKGLKEAMRRGGLASARSREDSGSEDTSTKKRRRLGLDRMISDGRPESPTPKKWDGSRLIEINNGSGRFTTLPTEIEEEASPATSKHNAGQEQTLHQGAVSPLSDIDLLRPNDTNILAPYSHSVSSSVDGASRNNYNNAPAVSSDMTNGYDLDPSLLQTTIGSLLQSPTTAQMFLDTLNSSSQGQALQSSTNGAVNAPTHNIGSGNNNNNHSTVPLLNNNSQPFQFNNTDFANDPTLALFAPLQPIQPNPIALQNNTNDLIDAYQKAQSIDTDMDQIQQSIDQLVQSMGLNLPKRTDGDNDVPNYNATHLGNGSESISTDPRTGVGSSSLASDSAPVPFLTTDETGLGHDGTFDDSEFDVNEFLDSLAKTDDDGHHV